MTAQPSPQLEGNNAFHRGDRLRKARENAGYESMKEFAELLGGDRGAFAKYERTGIIKNSMLIAWAWRTGVRLEWLTDASGPMYEPGNEPESLSKITVWLLPTEAVVTPIRPALTSVAA